MAGIGSAFEILVEHVRPELSRYAGFPLDVQEVAARCVTGGDPSIVLFSPVFGGLRQRAYFKIDMLANDARKFEREFTASLVKAIEEISQQAEMHAVVDYKWPKAA